MKPPKFLRVGILGLALALSAPLTSVHATTTPASLVSCEVRSSESTTLLDAAYLRVRSYFAAHPDQKVSLVIPAYNEEKRLPGTLQKLRDFLDQYSFPVEVLSIVEKSRDLTIERSREVITDDPRFEVVDNLVQRGKGYAVRSGVLRAQGDFIFYMDADLATPPEEIIFFLDTLVADESIDVVVGDRRSVENGYSREERGWSRYLMSEAFSSLVQLLTRVSETRDTQCGFKAFRRVAARDIFNKQEENRFAFDVEVLILAHELGYKISALPVKWVDQAGSTVHPVRDSWNMLRAIVKMRRQVLKRLATQKSQALTLAP